MPINIFGEIMSKYYNNNNKNNNQVYDKKYINKTFYNRDYINTNFLTKDETYDKDYINNYVKNFKDQLLEKFSYVEQNYMKKDILNFSPTFISLDDKRRIVKLKPGINDNDAINKKQMNDVINKLTNTLSRGKKSLDSSFLPYVEDGNEIDFENKRLRNLGNPIAPQDAVSLEYYQSNRITKVYLTGEYNARSKNINLTGGFECYMCFFDGTIFSVNTYPNSDIIVLLKNGISPGDKIPIQFKEGDTIFFNLKDNIDLPDKSLIIIYLDIVYKAI